MLLSSKSKKGSSQSTTAYESPKVKQKKKSKQSKQLTGDEVADNATGQSDKDKGGLDPAASVESSSSPGRRRSLSSLLGKRKKKGGSTAASSGPQVVAGDVPSARGVNTAPLASDEIEDLVQLNVRTTALESGISSVSIEVTAVTTCGDVLEDLVAQVNLTRREKNNAKDSGGGRRGSKGLESLDYADFCMCQICNRNDTYSLQRLADSYPIARCTKQQAATAPGETSLRICRRAKYFGAYPLETGDSGERSTPAGISVLAAALDRARPFIDIELLTGDSGPKTVGDIVQQVIKQTGRSRLAVDDCCLVLVSTSGQPGHQEWSTSGNLGENTEGVRLRNDEACGSLPDMVADGNHYLQFVCDEDSHSVGESGNRVRSHSHPLPKFTLTPDTEQNELHRLRTSISGGPPKQSTADFADDLSDEDDESQIGQFSRNTGSRRSARLRAKMSRTLRGGIGGMMAMVADGKKSANAPAQWTSLRAKKSSIAVPELAGTAIVEEPSPGNDALAVPEGPEAEADDPTVITRDVAEQRTSDFPESGVSIATDESHDAGNSYEAAEGNGDFQGEITTASADGEEQSINKQEPVLDSLQQMDGVEHEAEGVRDNKENSSIDIKPTDIDGELANKEGAPAIVVTERGLPGSLVSKVGNKSTTQYSSDGAEGRCNHEEEDSDRANSAAIAFTTENMPQVQNEQSPNGSIASLDSKSHEEQQGPDDNVDVSLPESSEQCADACQVALSAATPACIIDNTIIDSASSCPAAVDAKQDDPMESRLETGVHKACEACDLSSSDLSSVDQQATEDKHINVCEVSPSGGTGEPLQAMQSLDELTEGNLISAVSPAHPQQEDELTDLSSKDQANIVTQPGATVEPSDDTSPVAEHSATSAEGMDSITPESYPNPVANSTDNDADAVNGEIAELRDNLSQGEHEAAAPNAVTVESNSIEPLPIDSPDRVDTVLVMDTGDVLPLENSNQICLEADSSNRQVGDANAEQCVTPESTLNDDFDMQNVEATGVSSSAKMLAYESHHVEGSKGTIKSITMEELPTNCTDNTLQNTTEEANFSEQGYADKFVSTEEVREFPTEAVQAQSSPTEEDQMEVQGEVDQSQAHSIPGDTSLSQVVTMPTTSSIQLPSAENNATESSLGTETSFLEEEVLPPAEETPDIAAKSCPTLAATTDSTTRLIACNKDSNRDESLIVEHDPTAVSEVDESLLVPSSQMLGSDAQVTVFCEEHSRSEAGETSCNAEIVSTVEDTVTVVTKEQCADAAPVDNSKLLLSDGSSLDINGTTDSTADGKQSPTAFSPVCSGSGDGGDADTAPGEAEPSVAVEEVPIVRRRHSMPCLMTASSRMVKKPMRHFAKLTQAGQADTPSMKHQTAECSTKPTICDEENDTEEDEAIVNATVNRFKAAQAMFGTAPTPVADAPKPKPKPKPLTKPKPGSSRAEDSSAAKPIPPKPKSKPLPRVAPKPTHRHRSSSVGCKPGAESSVLQPETVPQQVLQLPAEDTEETSRIRPDEREVRSVPKLVTSSQEYRAVPSTVVVHKDSAPSASMFIDDFIPRDTSSPVNIAAERRHVSDESLDNLEIENFELPISTSLDPDADRLISLLTAAAGDEPDEYEAGDVFNEPLSGNSSDHDSDEDAAPPSRKGRLSRCLSLDSSFNASLNSSSTFQRLQDLERELERMENRLQRLPDESNAAEGGDDNKHVFDRMLSA